MDKISVSRRLYSNYGKRQARKQIRPESAKCDQEAKSGWCTVGDALAKEISGVLIPEICLQNFMQREM